MSMIPSLLFYLISSYAMSKIGAKFNIGSTVQYFIPFYNLVLICRCAQISAWWVLGLFIPLLNLGVIVYLYGTLGKQLGKNFWLYGLGSFLFGITIFIMAWDNSRPVSANNYPN
ncbi:MAG TPA: DUF5684 domain-containing protein [Negativicutes bacterium]|nr:DUF5684 domain-containing protein [Negativicutes bacterium]